MPCARSASALRMGSRPWLTEYQSRRMNARGCQMLTGRSSRLSPSMARWARDGAPLTRVARHPRSACASALPHATAVIAAPTTAGSLLHPSLRTIVRGASSPTVSSSASTDVLSSRADGPPPSTRLPAVLRTALLRPLFLCSRSRGCSSRHRRSPRRRLSAPMRRRRRHPSPRTPWRAPDRQWKWSRRPARLRSSVRLRQPMLQTNFLLGLPQPRRPRFPSSPPCKRGSRPALRRPKLPQSRWSQRSRCPPCRSPRTAPKAPLANKAASKGARAFRRRSRRRCPSRRRR